MMATVLGIMRFGVTLIFGIMVTTLFAGIEQTRKNKLITVLLYVIFLAIQTSCLLLFGLDLTSRLYPFIIHLPLVFIFALYLKRPWLISVVSVLAGYLCCQGPRWVGFLAKAVFQNKIADHVFYIASMILFFLILRKYVSESVRQLLEKSYQSCLLLGVVPLFYYLFGYATVINPGIFHSDTEWAVQFMPSVVSVFYFVFLILYYNETQKQAKAQRERDMLDIQFRHAQAEFASLRKIQQNAAAYRHDMRHHLSLLQSMVSEGRIDALKDYLQTVQSDMDNITPVRFCKNETINIILSSFAAKAKQAQICLQIDAKLPESLPFSDTELCSLLSNALENAIHACEPVVDKSMRCINLRIYSKNNKLCIDVRNRYQKVPTFYKGFPVSEEPGHGFGTKSMAYIVEKYGGVFQFSVDDGWFQFQATV